jgi:hypothetical protein
MPSLSTPQAGSTAATGTGAEGVCVAFVDPQNNLSVLTAAGTFVDDEFFGVVSTSGTSWTLSSGFDFDMGVFVHPTTSGSGTYVPKQSFTGSYVTSAGTTNVAWTYDPVNALSVTQQSVTGTWSETSSSMTIASDGSLTGTLSGCSVSGTMLLATAGTNQNLYELTVSAAASTSCQMPAGLVYTGSAAIVFLPITGSNGYARTIVYSVKAPGNTNIAYGQLSLQQ